MILVGLSQLRIFCDFIFFLLAIILSIQEHFSLPGPKELYFLSVWNLLSCSVTWKAKVFTATCHVIVISLEIIITSA